MMGGIGCWRAINRVDGDDTVAEYARLRCASRRNRDSQLRFETKVPAHAKTKALGHTQAIFLGRDEGALA